MMFRHPLPHDLDALDRLRVSDEDQRDEREHDFDTGPSQVTEGVERRVWEERRESSHPSFPLDGTAPSHIAADAAAGGTSLTVAQLIEQAHGLLVRAVDLLDGEEQNLRYPSQFRTSLKSLEWKAQRAARDAHER